MARNQPHLVAQRERGSVADAIQHRVLVRHAAHRPPRERRLRRSGVGRERLQPGVQRGAIAAGVVPPAHHRGQDEQRLVEPRPARVLLVLRVVDVHQDVRARLDLGVHAAGGLEEEGAGARAGDGVARQPGGEQRVAGGPRQRGWPTRSRGAVPRRRGDAARIRSTPAGRAGSGSAAQRPRARARPPRRDRRRPHGRGRRRVRRRRRRAPPRDRTPARAARRPTRRPRRRRARAAGKRAASAARFASLRAPTTSLVTSTSAMPPARKGSASEVFCTQMPTAPAATWRRAISTHLWLLACGRTRTLRPATACIRRPTLASNRSRSTISAGVSTSASASPTRAGIQRCPCGESSDVRARRTRAVESRVCRSHDDGTRVHMSIKSDKWIRRMAEKGMIEPFEPGQVREKERAAHRQLRHVQLRLRHPLRRRIQDLHEHQLDDRRPEGVRPELVRRHQERRLHHPAELVRARAHRRVLPHPAQRADDLPRQEHLRALRDHRQRHAARTRVGRPRDARVLQHDAAAGEDLRGRRLRPGAVHRVRRGLRDVVQGPWRQVPGAARA